VNGNPYKGVSGNISRSHAALRAIIWDVDGTLIDSGFARFDTCDNLVGRRHDLREHFADKFGSATTPSRGQYRGSDPHRC